MRVLHVYKSYYPDSFGGIEQVVFQLARGLRSLDVESRILTLTDNSSVPVLHRPEGDVHRFPITFSVASNPVSLGALRGCREHMRWADVIHYQFPWPFGDLLHLLHGRGRPSVVSYQSDVVRQKALLLAYRPLMRRFLASVGAVAATSPNYVATSPVLAGLRRHVDIVPNGIDETALPAVDERVLRAWRERLGHRFFLFVGVLRYYKGVDVLLRAAADVDQTVVIAGAGPESDSLKALAARLDLRNVHFLGEVNERDKVALYTLAHAFVFPSNLRSEAFGMSLVEASLFGKPMITCEIGTGTSFINLDGVTGYTVAPDNVDALARAMRRLADEPERAARMGRAARARYEAVLRGSTMAESYVKIYDRVRQTRAQRIAVDVDSAPGAIAAGNPQRPNR